MLFSLIAKTVIYVDLVFGLLAMLGSSISGLLRYIDTKRSKHTYGVSAGFAWLGFIASFFYLLFGVTANVAYQIPPSLIFLIAFTYLLYRIHSEPRSQWRNLLISCFTISLVSLVGFLNVDLYGFIAGLILIVGSVPQVFLVFKTKIVDGIGPYAWLSNALLALTWTCYGGVTDRLAIWAPNAISTFLALAVLVGFARARFYKKSS